MITKFLSNRVNLVLLQFVLYFIIGYIMGSHLNTGQFIIMFAVILLLQFITHIMAVADGMLYNQLMNDNTLKYSREFKQLIDKIKNNKSGDK